MITERLLSAKHKFRKDLEPEGLSSAEVEARRVFLREIYKDVNYVNVSQCPYCGGKDFTKISEVSKKFLPSEVVICDSCEGCFKSRILNDSAARRHYQTLSYALRGKGLSELEIENLFKKRLRLFARPRQKFISHFADLVPGRDLIAELGCNDGANLLPWKELGFSVLGIELDSVPAQCGRRHGIDIVEADLMTYEFELRKPKVIILSHVLGHVSDINRFMAHLSAVIAPDGYIFIETPNIRYYGALNTSGYFDVEFNYCFDTKSLATVLERHGFWIIYIDEFSRVFCARQSQVGKSLAKGRALPVSAGTILLQLAIRALDYREIGLYDLLRLGLEGDFRASLIARLKKRYFDRFYRLFS
ncbi:MAG: class I SAM-dependent methyltransferase [Candidatus Omnitrophica bacterium]|nr:class I SAM-dependent methyltransferase [Candidatus Omnitrophota bacterium]MCM8790600.1 class I SAM-dependent methyltransferase [Candidatus Omnitrophota bacterium]